MPSSTEKTASTEIKDKRYWNASVLCNSSIAVFENAYKHNDIEEMKNAFFILTHYYANTLTLSRNAFKERREPLARATLSNLTILDAALGRMHTYAPKIVPLAVPLTKGFRDRYVRGLIVLVLDEISPGCTLEDLESHLESRAQLGTLGDTDISERLDELIQIGTVEHIKNIYRRRKGTPSEISLGNVILRSIVGEDLAAKLAAIGIERTVDAMVDINKFIAAFTKVSGFSETTAVLMLEVLRTFINEESVIIPGWECRDLIHSLIPRPYQLEAYAVFCGFKYRSCVIEAPTGSGKTVIGMMCIQDWLRRLNYGESILVIVPTSNYQQQWVRELCYNDHGLGLAPEDVFAGTPSDLKVIRRRGAHPVIISLTYTAIAQISWENGKFDPGTLNKLLDDNLVNYVLLDEVHKVVEDLDSASSAAVRAMTGLQETGRLDGLIGFTGTGAIYSDEFVKIGLKLVHVIPMVELIAYGYVAPFAEFGVPFAWSLRERRIQDILGRYKIIVRNFLELCGGEALRQAFSAVPLAERVLISRKLLGMYAGRSDGDTAASLRLTRWESGGAVSLSELPLVIILQIATGRSDTDLVGPEEKEKLEELLTEANDLRIQLKSLMVLPQFLEKLEVEGFGTTINTVELKSLLYETLSTEKRHDKSGLLNATTITGLYDVLSDWYQHTGEGRVNSITSIIDAECSTRMITGTIIFDRGRRLKWRDEKKVSPGFDGVSGLFAQILGHSGVVPIAAQSQEIYLPQTDDAEIDSIAEYIRKSLMLDDIGNAIKELLSSGIVLGTTISEQFEAECHSCLEDFTTQLKTQPRSPMKLFSISFLRPMRKSFGRHRRGLDRTSAQHLRTRINSKNIHLRTLLRTFCDYARLAARFENLSSHELVQANGTVHHYYVITMPGGRIKQLAYDLVARLVDEPGMPFNTVIVSGWARTGWNVIRPNLLIDATATRNVTAWQQLRGRAIRAHREWSNDCYRLMVQLLGSPALGLDVNDVHLPKEVHGIYTELASKILNNEAGFTQGPRRLIEKIATPVQWAKIQAGGFRRLSYAERMDLAIKLMLTFNKVSHLHELVKATGSTAQLILNRKTGLWVRNKAIAAKHAHEVSLDLACGKLSRGDEHAPMIYSEDPRLDLPDALKEAIKEYILGCDPAIVKGWLLASMDLEQRIIEGV